MVHRRPTQLHLVPTPKPAKASLRGVLDIRRSIEADLEVITLVAPERLEDVYAAVQFFRRDLKARICAGRQQ